MSGFNTKIAFLGAGNMAEAIISGLVNSGLVEPRNISASDVRVERVKYLQKKYRIKAEKDNISAIKNSKIIFLCVKPQAMEELLCGTGLKFNTNQFIISIAAGITTAYIERFLIKGVPVVRAMPNTPLMAGAGAAGVCAGKYAKKTHVATAVKLFSASGTAVVVPEKKINAVTALSGSGPAYVFYLAEAMRNAGIEMGLDEDIADRLSRQTVFGSGKMLKEQDVPAAQMRKNVTSPGGTTEAALKYLDSKGFTKIFKEALKKAKQRAGELSK